jgi:hypothetical protein
MKQKKGKEAEIRKQKRNREKKERRDQEGDCGDRAAVAYQLLYTQHSKERREMRGRARVRMREGKKTGITEGEEQRGERERV